LITNEIHGHRLKNVPGFLQLFDQAISNPQFTPAQSLLKLPTNSIEPLEIVTSSPPAPERRMPCTGARVSCSCERTMAEPENLEVIGRIGLRALRIAASTLSIVELLRQEWIGGIGAGLAWIVFVQVEQRLQPASDSSDD